MPPPQPEKLLVVHDDANKRDLLSRRLARRGYSVDVAEGGADALAKIRKAHYDLVLMDQMMPGMSGFNLLQLLRATHSPSDLPVIMVTAVDPSQPGVNGLKGVAHDYAIKPVDIPAITERIETQLPRSKLKREARSEDGRAFHIGGSLSDIAARKASDRLTGLGNRLQTLERLAALIAIEGNAPPFAVVLLDLDGFKVINDIFGYGAGDRILGEVASRIRIVVANLGLTAACTVSRLGGDEFAVLLERVANSDQPRMLAESILARIAVPMSIQGFQMSLNASAGLAFGPSDYSRAEDVLRDADLAMYRAKDLGKNQLQVFEPEVREPVKNRAAMTRDLQDAIEHGQLEAFYQPKVNLATRAIVGFEALLRWRHPERGMIQPNDFIPLAEETGLIVPIGEWILGEACCQLKTWQNKFPCSPPLNMNVNLSVKQLGDPHLVEHVRAVLDQNGLEPSTLKLELTETALMTEIDSAKQILERLQAMHVGLKLDDFGTGYSSLSYLRALHFDSLKIDRSFVMRMAEDTESHAIVETIMKLARALDMSVVAEGIEDEKQAAELVRLGCETGQGFLFSKPVPAGAAEELLKAFIAGSA